jgi:hypothetical protein
MTGRYVVLAGRIRQDVAEIERVVERVERAVAARRRRTVVQDLLLDSIALNLHDFYSGLERIFTHIASDVDQSVPTAHDWHRELLRQMTVELPGLRPPVLTAAMAADADEFLRFRHVVRHIYAFALDPEQVERLAGRLPATFHEIRTALLDHATLLEGLAHEGNGR